MMVRACFLAQCIFTLWHAKVTFGLVPELSPEDLAAEFPDGELVRCSFNNHENAMYIQVRRDWAPLGAARFVELVQDGLFQDMALFRGLNDFLVQFGLAATEEQREKWRGTEIQDDPKNDIKFRRGIMSYAGSGPNTRGTQMFFTLVDRDTHLGTQPWEVPFAQVVHGKENLQFIETKYGDQVNQQEIWRQGYDYLKNNFPDLTYLDECKMVELPQKEGL